MPNTSGRCPRCGGDMAPGVTTSYDAPAGSPVVIENIPALVCGQRRDAVYTLAIAEEIDRVLTDRPAPARTVAVPFYDLAAAHSRREGG